MEKLARVESHCNVHNPEYEKFKGVSGNNWFMRRTKDDIIKSENKKIGENIRQACNKDLGGVKKKMKEDIHEYLKLRSSLRKFKFHSTKKLNTTRPNFDTSRFEKLHEINQKVKEKT